MTSLWLEFFSLLLNLWRFFVGTHKKRSIRNQAHDGNIIIVATKILRLQPNYSKMSVIPMWFQHNFVSFMFRQFFIQIFSNKTEFHIKILVFRWINKILLWTVTDTVCFFSSIKFYDHPHTWVWSFNEGKYHDFITKKNIEICFVDFSFSSLFQCKILAANDISLSNYKTEWSDEPYVSMSNICYKIVLWEKMSGRK